MGFNLTAPLRRSLKATTFWKDNYLILREFKYFPGIAILAIVFSIGAAAFEGFGLGFLLAFLQSLVNPDLPPIQTGWQWFDLSILGIDKPSTERLYRVSALILAATWIRAAFNYLAQIYTEMTQLNLVDRVRKRIFEQLQSLSLSYFSTSHSGELINTITGEISRLQQAFGLSAFLFTKSLTLAVYSLIMFQLSWQLSLMAIALFTLLAVGLSALNKQVREASFVVSKANGQFTSRAIEFINGIRTVQASGTQEFERSRYYKASNDVVQSSIKATLGLAIIRPLAEGAATTVLVSMIIIAITVFVTNGTLQVASLLTFLFTLFRVIPSIHEINGNRAMLSSFSGSIANVMRLLKTDDKKYLINGTQEFTGLKQAIEFRSVDFSYEIGALVLNNITLTIRKGQTTALVGSSGAGKTTLADLIPRFYDATQGQVSYDGVDLRNYDINTVRHRMAVVSQDTFIFNSSVFNNIAYGIESATQQEVEHAAQLANALAFILEMPEGFDTQLGDRGVRLSGGQRQRIAIARALLRNPEILILDEATSALDSVSERLIQESLEKLSVGRTVIAIAHRLSTIAKADKVVVLEQGKIVEQGAYQELILQRGKLWDYHKMQNESGQKS